MDFIEGTEIQPEHMEQKYGNLYVGICSSENITLDPTFEEEFAENPRYKPRESDGN